jgi:hypothetical protein
MKTPADPRTPARRLLLRTGRTVSAAAVAVVLVAGCALSRPKPPECDGPWTPINPVRTQAPA